MLVQWEEDGEVCIFKSNTLELFEEQFKDKDDKAHSRMVVQNQKVCKQSGDQELLQMTASDFGLLGK